VAVFLAAANIKIAVLDLLPYGNDLLRNGGDVGRGNNNFFFAV
jgi:hypothetical protein